MTKVYSSSQFSFRENTFSCESSDLGPLRAGPIDAQIYNDAADVGFYIRSEQTGKLACYYLHHTERDAEGDKLYDEYLPVGKHPSLFHSNELAPFDTYKHTKVIVFND